MIIYRRTSADLDSQSKNDSLTESSIFFVVIAETTSERSRFLGNKDLDYLNHR